MTKKRTIWPLAIIILLVFLLQLISCGGTINTNFDPHFNEDGKLQVDSSSVQQFVLNPPSKIKFYVEVSGSMNGFFRSGIATDFKTDVWQVMSYYSVIAPEVSILTNGGTIGTRLPLSSFRTQMNTGAFVSTASTKVPTMLKSIIEDLNADEGEVAILISDMKYDPVGSAAPDVLLHQYSIDISELFGRYGKAVSLIGATSSFADRHGTIVCEESPYYFLIIGNPEPVAEMRNGISTLLSDRKHFIDNIETGMKYGSVCYTFGIPLNCWQIDEKNPTFCGFDPSADDTCTIRLQIPLENYRWRMADEAILAKYFSAKCLYGSNVLVGNIDVQVDNKFGKHLKRVAIATVELKLTNMATESDVIEWQLTLPDTEYTLFSPFVDDVSNVNDISKSYSVLDFIRGMFHGSVLNSTLPPNYILVSQNS